MHEKTPAFLKLLGPHGQLPFRGCIARHASIGSTECVVVVVLRSSEKKVLSVGQLCPRASVALTNPAVTDAVETLGYLGLKTKFRSQIIFCSIASCNPLV